MSLDIISMTKVKNFITRITINGVAVGQAPKKRVNKHLCLRDLLSLLRLCFLAEFDWCAFLMDFEMGARSLFSAFFLDTFRGEDVFFLLVMEDSSVAVLLPSSVSSVRRLFLCTACKNPEIASSSVGPGMEAKCSAIAAASSAFGAVGFTLIRNWRRYFFKLDNETLSKSTVFFWMLYEKSFL